MALEDPEVAFLRRGARFTFDADVVSIAKALRSSCGLISAQLIQFHLLITKYNSTNAAVLHIGTILAVEFSGLDSHSPPRVHQYDII